MAISFIQGVSANASSVNLNSQAKKGDLIIVMAYNDASTTTPSVPTGYSPLRNATGTAQSAQTGVRISDGTDTTSGTWTNATNIVCLVYRGARTTGASGTPLTGNSATITYPTLTPQRTDGSSWVAAFCGAKGATAGMNGTTAALTANRSNQTTVNGLDTNGGVTSFAAQSLTVTGSGRFITFSHELLEAVADDEDEGWVGGDWLPDVATNAVILALLAASLFGAAQLAMGQADDQFSPQPRPIVEEEYWFNPVQPIAAADYQPLPYLFLEAPDDFTSFSTDEDLWQNWVMPQQEVFIVPPLWVDGAANDLPPPPPAVFSGEEDYWQNPVAPTAGLNLVPPLFEFEQHENLISFGLDEDYWQNPCSQCWTANLYPQQWAFQNDEQPAQFDEDYWQNPTAPVAIQEAWPQPFTFEQHDFATQFDEDYWQNWSVPTAAANLWLQPFTLEQHDFATQVEEEYWQNRVSPVVYANICPQPFSLEQHDFATQFDEDFWQNGVAPVAAAYIWPQPFSFEQHEFTSQVEEDYWTSGVAPLALAEQWPQQFSFDPVDLTFLHVDEDYQLPGVPQYQPAELLQQFAFDQSEIITTSVAFTPDEDYWEPPVFQQQQIAPTPSSDRSDELPATVAAKPVDEDYWIQPSVAATPSTNPLFSSTDEWVPQPFDEDYWFRPGVFAASNPAIPVFNASDESTTPSFEDDSWSQPRPTVAPIATLYQPDSNDELPNIMEEDGWQPPIPIVANQPPLQPFIFAFEQSEFKSILDEEVWQLGPKAVAITYPAYALWQGDESAWPPIAVEDYWQNATAPIAASLAYPQQFIFDNQVPELVAIGPMRLQRLAVFGQMSEYKMQSYGQAAASELQQARNRVVAYKMAASPQVTIASVNVRIPEVGAFQIEVPS